MNLSNDKGFRSRAGTLGSQEDSPQSPRKHSLLCQEVFRKLAIETIERLLLELPPNAKPMLCKQILAYLDGGTYPVLVRKGTRRFRVRAAVIAHRIDEYGVDPEILDDNEFNRYVLPFLVFPDVIWLQKRFGKLQRMGQELNLDGSQTEGILRSIVHEFGSTSHGKRDRKRRNIGDEGVVRAEPLPGMERNPDVATRRTELGKMMRSKRRPKAREICSMWDFKNFAVPEHWQLDHGVSTWGQALKQFPGNVHKLISVDRNQVKQRLAQKR